jgi:ABC-type branched-subunit amino acid transport system substrate-binding protein
VSAYDSAQVLLDAMAAAIQHNGRADRRSVLDALPGVRRRGLTGEIAFDEQGRRIDAPVWLYRLGDGQYPGALVESGP